MMGAANRTANQWIWGNEIVVHYDRTKFQFECPSHHNVPEKGANGFGSPDWSRSFDGGQTWTHFTGPNNGGEASLPIDFKKEGFGIYVPYKNSKLNEDWEFYVTYDRWKTRLGPYKTLNSLKGSLKGKELTSRTDYIVNSSNDIMLFMSGRDVGQEYDDYTFVARSKDGGKSFEYLSRITPDGDSARGVMPSVARLSDTRLVAAIRRRAKSAAGTDGGKDISWIDAFRSDDNGKSWKFVSKIDDTMQNNGNPPAMVALPNGLLAVVYGVRAWLPKTARMSLKVSADGGSSWNAVGESEIRDKYNVDVCGKESDATDLGYPRLFLLPDGKLRAVYAWSDGKNENHMSSTLFEVIGKGSAEPQKPEPPKSNEKYPIGLFEHKGTVYYSNGSDAFCGIANPEQLKRCKWDKSDRKKVDHLPAGMRKDGLCRC